MEVRTVFQPFDYIGDRYRESPLVPVWLPGKQNCCPLGFQAPPGPSRPLQSRLRRLQFRDRRAGGDPVHAARSGAGPRPQRRLLGSGVAQRAPWSLVPCAPGRLGSGRGQRREPERGPVPSTVRSPLSRSHPAPWKTAEYDGKDQRDCPCRPQRRRKDYRERKQQALGDTSDPCAPGPPGSCWSNSRGPGSGDPVWLPGCYRVQPLGAGQEFRKLKQPQKPPQPPPPNINKLSNKMR
ncbi:uncharacterized protein LOC110346020 [Heterocephalus glaber]|uniref:Uncharacterized protein LOC110346020 n=1 Tax=Heterocephalus glaber TaxID=10181 RepID=A0AAX6RXE2_HETGA|nr:uncharacterized protein LOC110346020 [Heterocephalus glaber]